ncbi:MAG: hypothetical protein PVJ57_09475 [Phycisphaerae bacterium]|jgi:hypothetical protein
MKVTSCRFLSADGLLGFDGWGLVAFSTIGSFLITGHAGERLTIVRR